jgi:hypothetical protein
MLPEGLYVPSAMTLVKYGLDIWAWHEIAYRQGFVCGACFKLPKTGRLVIVDSLQFGDEPRYDGMLDLFPQNFHEPYYRSYLREDFPALGMSCGLIPVREANAFVSKVMVFDKR